MLTRICAGLAPALGGLDDDAARLVQVPLERTHEVVPLLPQGPARAGWYAALELAGRRRDLPPLLGGRIARLLMDVGVISRTEAADRLHAALSVGATPAEKAQWAEGFTAGGALLLIHDDALLGVLDRWVRQPGRRRISSRWPRCCGAASAASRRRNAAICCAPPNSLSGGAAQARAPEMDLTRADGVLATARLLLQGAS